MGGVGLILTGRIPLGPIRSCVSWPRGERRCPPEEEEQLEEEEDVNSESQFPLRLKARRGGEGNGGEIKEAPGFLSLSDRGSRAMNMDAEACKGADL